MNVDEQQPQASTSAVTLDASFPDLWPTGHVPFVRSNKKGKAASSAMMPEPITRDNLVKARQEAIERVADSHDTHVRELFHMDRVTSMVYYDPQVAKRDNSRVWQDFSKQYDLTNAVEATS